MHSKEPGRNFYSLKTYELIKKEVRMRPLVWCGLLVGLGLAGCGGGSGNSNTTTTTPPTTVTPTPIVANAFSGRYDGTMVGFGSSPAQLTLKIAGAGTLTASTVIPNVATYQGTGKIAANGGIQFDTSGGLHFSGSIGGPAGAYTGSGSWESDSGMGGTWTAKYTQPCAPPALVGCD